MDDEAIIEAVEKRKSLYDRNGATKCMNRKIVNSLWEQCAQEIGTDVIRIKKRWAFLRQCFVQHYRISEKRKAGLPTKMARKWPLYNKMKFLSPYLQDHQEMNLSKVDQHMNEDNSISFVSIPEVSSESVESVPKPFPTQSKKKMKPTRNIQKISSPTKRSKLSGSQTDVHTNNTLVSSAMVVKEEEEDEEEEEPEDGVDYVIVDGLSQRQQPKLMDSNGYCYNKDRENKDGSVTWRCAIRSKSHFCGVRLTQRGKQFFNLSGKVHNHLMKPGNNDVALIVAKIKEKVIEDVSVPAKQIVDEVLNEHANSEFATPRMNLLKIANRYREKIRKCGPSGSNHAVHVIKNEKRPVADDRWDYLQKNFKMMFKVMQDIGREIPTDKKKRPFSIRHVTKSQDLLWTPDSQSKTIAGLESDRTCSDLEEINYSKQGDTIDGNGNEHFLRSLLPMMSKLDPDTNIEFRMETERLLLHYIRQTSAKLSETTVISIEDSALDS